MRETNASEWRPGPMLGTVALEPGEIGRLGLHSHEVTDDTSTYRMVVLIDAAGNSFALIQDVVGPDRMWAVFAHRSAAANVELLDVVREIGLPADRIVSVAGSQES